MQNRTTMAAIALLGALALGGLGLSGGLYLRLVALEGELARQGGEAAKTPPAEVKPHTPPPPAEKADGKVKKTEAPVAAKPAVLEIGGMEYIGDEEIKIKFNLRPDLSVIRDYVTVTPKAGALAFCFYDESCKTVSVKGDFAFGTNSTLKVRSGMPAAEKGTAPLAADWTENFERKDRVPTVNFAAAGRYLPPGGARMLAIESVNVTNVLCAAAAIPCANIVQMLAREEGEYRRYRYWNSSADSEDTEDLSDSFTSWEVPVKHALNTPVISQFALRKLPGAASNGVFLVAMRSADRERRDDSWWWNDPRGEKKNPNRYRLVCITDIGLTVRRDSGRITVWATSLTTGVPYAGCRASVFGSNNRLLAQGRTDATGLCTLELADKAEPFVVTVRTESADDTTFICLSEKHAREERDPEHPQSRPDYLKPSELTAFVWTERDIYRHGEKMFVEALVRNGRHVAPASAPLVLRLLDPSGRVQAGKTCLTDARGSFACADFSVPAELPGGRWLLDVSVPGSPDRSLGSHAVSVEEFAPPQIRVRVAGLSREATNYAFAVTAEHLYGQPAAGLVGEAAVTFRDEPFEPRGWNGWRFGNADLGLEPNFRRLDKVVLDGAGRAVFQAPMKDVKGRPRAAVCVTGEGTVFESGGRPARARVRETLHLSPFYIGTTLGGNVRVPANGFARVKVACVRPDGTPFAAVRRLKVAFSRIDCVYSHREDGRGRTTWSCDRLRVPVAVRQPELVTDARGTAELEIPFRSDGDYVMTVSDEGDGASFGATFWLGSRGDDAVRAPLANPAAITLAPDREIYRPGEVPRILVKSPFAGWALLSVMRDKVVSTRAFRLEKPSCELELEPVAAEWTPNADVSLSVVRTAENGGYRQTARAHGFTTIAVRRRESELPVSVEADFTPSESGGGRLAVKVNVAGPVPAGAVATVTVVDEGIHLLTDYRLPDPVAFFSRLRTGRHPLVDLFDNLLPVWDGDPDKVSGVKTGGGGEEDMMGRVSPVPSRRFKPLALWKRDLPVADGRVTADFALPQFVGEVRVTALVRTASAAGAGEVRAKVAPRLVVQAEAPRFASPGDVFDATLSLDNRSGVKCEVAGTAPVGAGWRVALAAGARTNLVFRMRASEIPGTRELVFKASGCGESHTERIGLPVRPAVAAREKSGTWELKPGELRTLPLSPHCPFPAAAVREIIPCERAHAQFAGALEYLADYPHGCLEQTVSRIFPLIAAGGYLNRLAAGLKDPGKALDCSRYVAAGVKRVESMMRARDFTMWPDCDYAPWDREVSLYAAHFLIAAKGAGVAVSDEAHRRVMAYLGNWLYADSDSSSCYAACILAVSGKRPLDRMLDLYERRAKLDALSRSRLAWAHALSGERDKAAELLAGCSQPCSVREAAFAVGALLACDPDDQRLAGLVRHLESKRGRERFHWGTTGDNAHALMAIGAYCRHHPGEPGTPRVTCTDATGTARELAPGKREKIRGEGPLALCNGGTGSAWVAWRTVEIPRADTVTNEAHVLRLSRSYLTPEGRPADLNSLRGGDLLIVELSLSSEVSGSFNDLVIQDLFPAACEPVTGGYDGIAEVTRTPDDWVMRRDARDDRMLVFSRKFELEAGGSVRMRYPLRVVTAGEFCLPGATVEAMYAPEINSSVAPGRMRVVR